MSFINEGRVSDSPYVETIWRGQAGKDCFPICPAEGRWHLLLLKKQGRVQASIAGPMTRARIEAHAEGVEWLVIKFKLGTFLPSVPMSKLVDGKLILPEATRTSFWLSGAAWEFPDYDNAETFVDRLVHDQMLLHDPVVEAALQNRPQAVSLRTVRHHFLQVIGVTRNYLFQIERARLAASLLEQGISIPDTVYQAGFADQPHLTRSLKRFIGQTPAQIVRGEIPE